MASVKFALIGAAGYIAPRHMAAIHTNGGIVAAAFDPHDSVGQMDAYFPGADFFVEFERFDRHLEKRRRQGSPVDYVTVCSPNYLHDSHIRFGLRAGADVVCEKPLVLNPWNADALREAELETGHRINTILQLRLHPEIAALKKKVESAPPDKIFDIDLTYITSRGHWYYASWKGDPQKSGGIATNIGIHFFDMLLWIFGEVRYNEVYLRSHDRASGYLELARARVRWFLSIDQETIPSAIRAAGIRTYRMLEIDGQELEFSGGFSELHNLSYAEILRGRGFGVKEVQPAIRLTHDIRNAGLSPMSESCHPLAGLKQTPHPFFGR